MTNYFRSSKKEFYIKDTNDLHTAVFKLNNSFVFLYLEI